MTLRAQAPRVAMPTPTPDVAAAHPQPAQPGAPAGPNISTLRSDQVISTPAPVIAPGERPCPRCRESNPPESRFCHACGFGLAGPPPTAAVVARPVLAPQPAASSPMVAIVCSRCRGVADPGADFCKFCGARLTPSALQAEGPPAGHSASAPPEARREPVPASPPRPIVSPASQPLPVPVPMLASPIAAPLPLGAASPGGGPQLLTPLASHVPEGMPELSGGAPRLASSPAPARPIMGATKPHHGLGEQPQSVPAVRGKIVRIAKDGSEGVHHPISGEQTDVGRTEGNIILPDDPYLSPRHARIVARAGTGLVLADLGSVNGTYVRLRTPHPLTHGDLLLLGQQVLRFEAVSELEGARGPAMQHGVLLFGSPAPVARARLVQRTVEGLTRDVLHLVRDEVTLGREIGDRTFPEDVFMSRRHATIRREGGSFVLHDLGSSNGTFVQIHAEHVLQDADQFRIGHHLFRVDLARETDARTAFVPGNGA